MKERLSGRDQVLIGLTLFSMFFGAGNLIFPPFLGAQAGRAVLPAFAGFAVSAVGLPILAVMAVAKTGGLQNLAGRVSGRFAAVFTTLVYLSIGPCLAIPRTASTSFSMAVSPFAPAQAPLALLQLGYSVVFFGAAAFLALHPERLSDRLGKLLCPALLTLIVLLFAGCLIRRITGVGTAQAGYAALPLVQGFLDGYQTMDAIAGLIFGIIIAINIRQKGVSTEKSVLAATVRAGAIAAVLFLAVYGMLTYVGAVAGGNFVLSADANGADLLTELAKNLFGILGQLVLAAIFFIACFNTCVGLLCSCSEYFSGIFKKLPFSYRGWVAVFAVCSAVVSNAGLSTILKFSVPLLGCIYPVAITLIVLAFLPQKLVSGTAENAWPVALAGVFGSANALDASGVTAALSALPLHGFGVGWCLEKITALAALLPFYAAGLGWVLPAIAGFALALLAARAKRKYNT